MKAAWYWLAFALGLGPAMAAERSLIPPAFLPDGTEFKTWEEPLRFTRTYHVDQGHPRASDDNPGSAELPFRTLTRAAQALQPGERVVVGTGVYRERVSPARGGAGPDRMISYEAAPGAQVVLSGAETLSGSWTLVRPSESAEAKPVWRIPLPPEWFQDGNPFAEINLTDAQIDRCMDWAKPIKGRPVLRLRRGLIFQDGVRLRQVLSQAELAVRAGAYWVETNGLAAQVRPFGDVDASRARFEATARGFVFAPRVCGLGYIRVKGFTIERSGNCFPRPQLGALSTQRGHHWIIEDNLVRQCNAIGIDIGDQFDVAGPDLAEGGRHIVRRNRIGECGIGGLEGKSIAHTLIEDNVIRNCGWHDLWPLYETGGIKVHLTRSCLLRRNLVRDTTAAPGIWLDWGNVNSRVTGNIILDVHCDTGGIFMEASQQPNLVDHNLVWGTRGNGIYQHDCDELTIAHNLVAHSRDAAVRMQVCQGRTVLGRPTTARRNKILNNVFLNHARPLAISDPDNVSDCNVFAGPDKGFDLVAWQAKTGWDKRSVRAALEATLDPATLAISVRSLEPLPLFPRLPLLNCDFLGRPADASQAPPGPFAHLPYAGTTLSADPGPAAAISLSGSGTANPALEQAIRQVRTGTLVIETAPGAEVRVEQLRHEFWFGAALANQMFGGRPGGTNEAQYKKVLLENFNSAVTENALKWHSMEPRQGEVDYTVTDAMLDWTRRHDIPLRGHNVFWGIPNRVQPWLKTMDNDTLRETLKARAIDVARRYRGRFAEYDLNNEMLHGNYYEERLGAGITRDMAAWMRQEDPQAALYLNDYDILTGRRLDDYVTQIRRFLDQGVPVAGIGVQGHLHGDSFDPAALQNALDRLAQFRLPIRVTEFNMPGQRSKHYGQRGARLSHEEELAKAKALADYYRICFAHPAVEGVLMWGFWEGANWIPVSSLFRRDWSPTPAAEAYRDLVFNQWWTRSSARADAQGRCDVRAFFGKHRVTSGGREAVVELKRREGSLKVALAPAASGPK